MTPFSNLASTKTMSTRYRPLLAIAAGSFALASPAACAQQAEAPSPDDAAGISVVNVTGQALQPDPRTALTGSAQGLPAGTTVLGQEDVATVTVGRDISNIFRRVPGVVANNLDQGDTGNGFKMRGFATQGTHGADAAVYIDGVPQNMPSSEAGAGHGPAFLEWLTPDMVERIEVIKGPVSARHSDQNRSGAVNIVTRSGGPSSVGLAVESFGGRRLSLVHAASAGRLDSFLVADRYRTDGYRKGSWLDRDNLFWRLSTVQDNARYSARINHYRSSFGTAGYLNYAQLSAGSVARDAPEPGVPAGFGEGRRSGLTLNRTPLDDRGLHLTAYAEDFERLRATSAGAVLHNAGLDDRRIHGGSLAWRAAFPNASLLAGADYRRDKGIGTRQRYQNRQPTSTWLTNLDLDLATWGVFAEAQYKPAASLKLTAGMRHDWFDYAIGNRKLPAASGDYDQSVFTPKLGLAWTPRPGLSVFANAAEGFRSAAAQQISPAGAAGALGAAGGQLNAGIEPSKVRSFDVGFQARPGTAWSLSGTAFHVLNEDEIVQTGPASFAGAGETTRRGFELDTRWRVAEGVNLYASYTRLLRAEFDNPLPNTQRSISVARHQLKAGLELRQPLAEGSMRYNLDGYLTSGIPYATGTPLAERNVPTHIRYDLRVSWDYRQVQLSAYATIQPHAIGESFYASATGLWVSPQPRRFGGAALRYFF